MNLNTKLTNLLNLWFYDDITKIIMSYRTFDKKKLLYENIVPENCHNIYLINKIILCLNLKYGKKIHLNIISNEEIPTNTKTKSTILFDDYMTYNIMYKNLLCDSNFSLYYKNENVFNLYRVNKLKIYKKCIYYACDYEIYKVIIEKTHTQSFLIYKINPKCFSFDSDNLDFDTCDDKFYIFDPEEKKILLYGIPNNCYSELFKFSETQPINLSITLVCGKIFATKDFVFLRSKFKISIFSNDLTLIENILLSPNYHGLNGGFYVEDNIVCFIDDIRIKIYKLY